MTNVVFVVSRVALVRAEPAGGGEGDFLKLCLQTDPADCFPFAARSLERKKKNKKTPKHKQQGLSQSASLHVGRKMLFPWGNGPGSDRREERSVGWVMTNAPGAHHLSCRVNKEVQTPSGWEPRLTCCSHPSHTWGIHTLYKPGVLKWCQGKTPPHLTSSPSARLE